MTMETSISFAGKNGDDRSIAKTKLSKLYKVPRLGMKMGRDYSTVWLYHHTCFCHEKRNMHHEKLEYTMKYEFCQGAESEGIIKY